MLIFVRKRWWLLAKRFLSCVAKATEGKKAVHFVADNKVQQAVAPEQVEDEEKKEESGASKRSSETVIKPESLGNIALR